MRRTLSAALYPVVICTFLAATPALAASKSVACHAKDLQDAMSNANEGDILSLAPNCDYEITDPSRTMRWDRRTSDNRALPAVNTTLTIEGNGATIPQGRREITTSSCESFAYAGNCLGRKVFSYGIGHSQMGIFTVVKPANLTLKNLILTNGTSRLGSAIWQEGGNVVLESVTIKNSFASGEFLYKGGNRLPSTEGRGGAILQSTGTMTIKDSTIKSVSAQNYGGAIYSENGKLDLIRTTIEGSTTGRAGGALYIANSVVNISDSPLLNNAVDYNYDNYDDDYTRRLIEDIKYGELPKYVGRSLRDPSYTLSDYYGMPVPPSGGAIYLEAGSLSLSGAPTMINKNITTSHHFKPNIGFPSGLKVEAGPGGGIYAREGTTFSLSNGATITGNTPDNCNSVIAKSCGQ